MTKEERTKKIATVLRLHRLHTGLSLERLARRIGTSISTVSHIENEKIAVTPKVMKKILEYFKTSEKELLGT